MATKRWKSIKGRVARITRLDECGAPVFGTCSTVVTEGFITITWSHEYTEGDEFEQKNAWGEFCINDKDPDTLKRVPVAIEFCEVDPDVLDIIGGASPVIVATDTIGATFGPNMNMESFALEVWTKKAGVGACSGGAGAQEWGYAIFPYVKNGKLDGDVTIENGPLSLTMAGEGHSASAAWGVGPHGDNPFMATTGFPEGDMWGMVITTVQPPAATDGCQPLTDVVVLADEDASAQSASKAKAKAS